MGMRDGGPRTLRWLAWIIAVAGLAILASAADGRHAASASGTRPVTVADGIEMNRIVGPLSPASFSPDGKLLAVVMARGDLKTNTNVYVLYVIPVGMTSHSMPRRVTSFSSSSNRDGISHVTWLADNDTITFLGENPGELTSLYAVSYRTGRVRLLARHNTNLTAYSMSADGRRIVFAAEKKIQRLLTDSVRKGGFPIAPSLDLAEMIRGNLSNGNSDQCDLFVLRSGGRRVPLHVSGGLIFPSPDLFVSPDGKYLALRTLVNSIDPAWNQYDDPVLKSVLVRNLPAHSTILIQQVELVDLDSGQSRALINAPVGYHGFELLWSADSHSVLVTDVHLPLDSSDDSILDARRRHTFVAQVDVQTGQIHEVSTTEKAHLKSWNAKTGILLIESGKDGARAAVLEGYSSASSGWRRTPVPQADNTAQLDIFIDQDLNASPRIVRKDAASGRAVVLLDPNPQLSALALARVEAVRWKDPRGRDLEAALYLPPAYRLGRRYPLVIQTHGYHPHEFWMDGPYTTAFAAQALAGAGMVVLQTSELGLGTADEGQQNMEMFESAISLLDQRGIIDPQRVGIIGFSRTSYHVKYALTRSNVTFAAASIADGMDAGYLQYLLFANENPNMAAEFELLVGGAPFGTGLRSWLNNSPGFLLSRVHTPLEIESIGPASLLAQWEWFAGLSRLGKPVDQVYIPTGIHVLQKPWDRMVSEQTNVDWFVFWLEGKEDSDPNKRQQYERWRRIQRIAADGEPGPVPD
jgi:dipeptidyl aminopeptidase/acylaminoacyl peptidase